MANTPPTGTVTFLFTDVEGSTALWENYPTRMPQIVERHDQIVRENVEDHGGYVFKTVGDACCAAFAYPREALKAALATQRALFAERWGGTISLRVRMALHTGFAEQERDGDYFGPAVNRVARVLSAGHGGQVLLSGATYNLVRDHPQLVDEGARFVDLGEHRLKDITNPERIYQLSVNDLPGVFPSLGADKTPDDFDERYRFKRFLGSGGMAKVYLAHDQRLKRDVAIKVLHPRYVEDQEFVERFEREAWHAASLSHPNIVPIHDRGEKEDGTYYMIMEYLPGDTLKDLIVKESPLSPRTALELTLQVAEALEEAHEKGVIHRDIKPQNVLLTHRGNAKVADFGIAKAASATRITRTGGVMGTPHYIAPEQAEGHPASPKSDLYSLGVVLYEMLTGELPYDAETPMGVVMKHLQEPLRPPTEVNPNVPDRANALVTRLLAKDPEKRYRDAAQLAGELRRLLRSLDEETDEAAPKEDENTVEGRQPTFGGSVAGKDSAATISEGTEPSIVGSIDERLREDSADNIPETVLEETSSSAIWVPDLTGQDAFSASNTVAETDLTLGDQKETPSETVPEGQIIEQTPRAGTVVEPNSLVSVTVSSGSSDIEVPDLTGRILPEAREALSIAGLTLGDKREVPSDAIAKGRVTGQDPAAGTTAKRGSPVNVAFGSGQEQPTAPDIEPQRQEQEPRTQGKGILVFSYKRVGALVAVVLVLAMLVSPFYLWGSSRYFLGFDEGEVVVYRGLPYAPWGLELSEEVRRTGLEEADVEERYRDDVEGHRLYSSEEQVEEVVRGLEAG